MVKSLLNRVRKLLSLLLDVRSEATDSRFERALNASVNPFFLLSYPQDGRGKTATDFSLHYCNFSARQLLQRPGRQPVESATAERLPYCLAGGEMGQALVEFAQSGQAWRGELQLAIRDGCSSFRPTRLRPYLTSFRWDFRRACNPWRRRAGILPSWYRVT